ncbi:MAG: YfiR family protein [Candidatus Competibacter sp.]
MKHLCRWLTFLIAALLTRPLWSEAYSEYAVKAAYLYNFAKFVEWPPGAFSKNDAPLVICIAGDNPFGDTLTVISNKTVDNHPVEVRNTSVMASFDRCHIIFISRAEQGRFKTVLAKLARLPILTVSDISGFAQFGGMIELFEAEQRIRFNININAARQANLRLSSQLLKLATIVN